MSSSPVHAVADRSTTAADTLADIVDTHSLALRRTLAAAVLAALLVGAAMVLAALGPLVTLFAAFAVGVGLAALVPFAVVRTVATVTPP